MLRCTSSVPPAMAIPWANSAGESHLASPEEYRAALEAAGFEILTEVVRREEALAFFERSAERLKSRVLPKLSLALVMGVAFCLTAAFPAQAQPPAAKSGPYVIQVVEPPEPVKVPEDASRILRFFRSTAVGSATPAAVIAATIAAVSDGADGW